MVSHGLRQPASTCETDQGLQLDVLTMHARPRQPDRR
jgi:hypothetical protein